MAESKRTGKRSGPTGSSGDRWSDVERDAMRAAARERRKVPKLGPEGRRAAGEAAVRDAIDALSDADRAMAARVHELVLAAAPQLVPRTFYGMPAYERDGKVVCFFQAAAKFKTRYATLGFQQEAKLDEGGLWPVAFAVVDLTPETEGRITQLVRRAVG